MHVFRKTGVFVCLSASLFVLGTYLCVIKVPVWVGNEFEPMHAYLPCGFSSSSASGSPILCLWNYLRSTMRPLDLTLVMEIAWKNLIAGLSDKSGS